MNTQILEEFGLTENEIEIFLTLIKKGSQSATQVAKETGQNRPYVYYALERLLEKGYITQEFINNKKHFKSISLNQIESSQKQKLEIFSKLIEELKIYSKKDDDSINVEILKGKFVIRNLFKKAMSELKPNEEVLTFGIDEKQMEEIEPMYLKKIFNFMKDNNITEKVILKKGTKKLDYAKTSKYKFINPELIGNTAKIIYQDTVIDIIYGTPIYGIVSKNQLLAETAKKQFELFWKYAKSNKI